MPDRAQYERLWNDAVPAAADNGSPRKSTAQKESIVISETPLTLLLVDDSTVDRTLYRHFLGSTALFTFLEATTGEEGLRLCRTAQPDCLILDFYLPDMDGFAFLDALQTETVSLPYPVVMLTGQGSEQLAVQSMHRGVQDYVVKDDLSADMLRRVITNAVDKFRLQQMLKAHRSLLQEQNDALRRQEEALQTLNATLAQQVVERTALLELLQAITAAANEATSLEAVLQLALDQICAYTGWPVGHVYLAAPDHSGLWMSSTIWHLDMPARFAAFQEATQALHIPKPGNDIIGRVIASGQPEWHEDVTTDPAFRRAASAKENGLHSVFACPILVGREVVGVMEVYAEKVSQPHTMLLDIGVQIGIQLGRVVERQRAAAQFQQQQEALYQSEKLAAMGSLLSGVAHELNNPLAAVLMHTDLLREELSHSPSIELVDEVTRAAERCTRLVRAFLTLARQHTPERIAVSLNSLVTETVELLAYALRVDNVTVHLDLAENLPLLWADPHQIQQVITNLITNAHQAMRESVLPRQLTLTTQCDSVHTRVTLAVMDTGPGIPLTLRARIFEPFFTTKPVGIGTGLGLSLCRGIIERHGGTITVSSQPGQGAVFCVALPVEAIVPTASTAPGRDSVPAVPDTSILIIDDEPSIASGLKRLLSRDGYSVETVANGHMALTKLQERSYDLLLSDMRMPEIDGPSLYRTLEQQYPHLLRRVIFLTGDTLNPETKTFLDQSAAPCLTKPCTVTEIRRVIQQVLQTQVIQEKG
jgi:signal transduction histidine kinase/DNA-binding response OmpR family regulator